MIVGISVTILLAIYGFDYYTTPLEERFFNSDHNLLKPSGTLGHGFGIVGTLMMIIGVGVYMIRKRYRKFFNIGYLKHWLEFHIFLCSVGPVLVLYHTAFKFGGIVSVSFWSMVLVVLSGVVGRFIYLQIPRTIQGQEISINELNTIKEKLAIRVRSVLSEDSSTLSEFEKISSADRYKSFRLITAVGFFVRDYFDIKRVMRLLKMRIKLLGISKTERDELIKAAKSEIVIARRIALLRTFQKLFHWWHIFHLPFAITMFVIMVIHVAVTIIFGYKWIF
ncbi:MAG: hypothetical protein A2W30_05390 [Ignavibacteria bacterium RBG_16_36_9]|nr:MAG: hypothetical protein A2W30_05390 [Ignavibacteria bacterium RBG_16_36_9]